MTLTSITDFGANIAFLIFETGWKSAVVLGFAVLFVRVLKRRSASFRQAILSTGIIITLVSALLVPFSPHWTIPSLDWFRLTAFDKAAAPPPESLTTPDLPAAEEANQSRETIRNSDASFPSPGFANETGGSGSINSLLSVIAFIWLLGVIVLGRRLWKNLFGLKGLRKASSVWQSENLSFSTSDIRKKFGTARRVTILRNETIKVPLTWGVFRHFILLPNDFERLSAESRHAVLIHESAHVKRHDFIVRMLADITCAILWFQPFVWAARRKLREEQERAADDCVLAAGGKASDYAKMLLELYDRLPRGGLAMGVGIIETGSLKARLEAILSNELKRRPPAMPEIVIIALVGLALAIPLATLGFSKDAALNSDSAMSPNENPSQILDENIPPPQTQLIERNNEATEVLKKNAHEDNSSERLRLAANTSTEQASQQGQAADFPSVSPTATPVVVEVSSPENQSAPQNFEAGPNFLRDGMAEVGYPNLSEAELAALRKADASHFYVRELAAAGYAKLPLKTLIRLRENGVSAQYVKEMKAFGYENLSPEMLSDFRWFGVSSAYIREMEALGYGNLPAKTIVAFRRHSVSSVYIVEMRSRVKGGISANEIVDMRSMSVTWQFIDDLARIGYERLTANQLISMRQHGVTIDFIEKMKTRDNRNYSANDLISMRMNGEK
jgi:beta-lactamase regulating signal transducer with metallopeptidase domain